MPECLPFRYMWRSFWKMLNKSVMNFIGCDAGYEEADIVLYGAPFDSTTSFRPGTRFAGQAVRNDSYGLETYSPYQDRDLEDCRIFDLGDLELAIGDSELVLSEIEKTAETILKDKKLPFMIGGEHLVTLGAVRAAARQYPELHIIHLDAHTDLREDYLGVLILIVAIVITLASRIIEVFMYLSIAPIPMATMMDSGEWASIGKNWIKQLLALSFQGFFIVVALGIFKTLFSNAIVALNASTDGVILQMGLLLGYTAALIFTILRTGAISKSVFNAH
mgnify:CR=1 FL=1